MATYNGLPVFKIFINDSLENKEGIDFISLVDHPAIEVNWVAMSSNAPVKMNFNQDQKLLYGPILIPDLPIYRNDPVNGEYYVVFTKEEIQTIVRKFQKQNKNLNLNYQHQPNSQINAVVQEIWLTGQNDKSKDYGFNLPVGSAFAVTYVEDNAFWNEQVKTGNVKGYSIEGWLDMKMNKQLMKKTLGKIQKYDVIKRAQSNDLYINGPIAIGNYVYYNQPQIVLIGTEQQELRSPIWDSSVELFDGRILELTEGKITQIIESVAAEHKRKNKLNKNKFMEAQTSDGMTLKTPAETFAVGVDATVTDAAGVETPADGEYTLDNGMMVKCAAGKVTEVTQAAAAADLTPEEVAAMSKIFSAIIKPLEDKITALETKLANTPGTKTATSTTDKETKKPTAAQTAYNKILELKKTTKK